MRGLRLPGDAAVSCAKHSTLFAGDERIVAARDAEGEELRLDGALLIIPRRAAVIRAQDDAARPDRIAALRVEESDGVEPLFPAQVSVDELPRHAAILRAQDSALRADRNAVLVIREMHVFEPRQRIRHL